MVCFICVLPSGCMCVWLCRRVCMYKMDMTQESELEGRFRLVYRANGTIMDIRGLSLPGICIWVFCNLTLLQKDASAPPVIYHSIKPILYYNLIHLPLVQTKAMSVLCNFSKPFLSSAQLLYFYWFPAINWVNTSETQLRIISNSDVRAYFDHLKHSIGETNTCEWNPWAMFRNMC